MSTAEADPLDDPTVVRAAVADERPRLPKGEERRQRILQAAVELITEKGFRGLRIAEIAERVGMTHPGLLYYFGSKERLLFEVIKDRTEADLSSAAITFSPDHASIALLADIARSIVEDPVYPRFHAVLLVENLDEGSLLHDYFVERQEAIRNAARACVASDVEHGLIRADLDIDSLALEIVSFLVGVEQQWLLDPGRIDLVAVVEAYVGRLFQTLAPLPSEGRKSR